MAVPENVAVNMETYVQGSNLLALNLHKALARNGQNFFISPFSVSSVFAMLLYGVRGDAASEMSRVLGYEDFDNEALATAFQSIISALDKSGEGYTISYANSLIIHKNFDVAEKFRKDLENYFKALCLQADFVNESEAAVKQINEWVNKKTNSMITQLLESLDSDTVMVLLNAIYFKGLWLKQFKEKSTFLQYFYNDGLEDEAKLVEMMHLNESFLFVEKESFKVLQLPYKGEDVAMLLFLPSARDGLHEIEDMLTPSFISEIKNEMHKGKVEVALPKFRLEYSNDLKETFKELGMKQIFSCGADYGGICSCKNLAVSQVIHKAVLEVNEEGCEAAASTAAVVMCRSLVFNPEFIVDHPFAFVIYNMRNDLILFSGRVTELQEKV